MQENYNPSSNKNKSLPKKSLPPSFSKNGQPPSSLKISEVPVELKRLRLNGQQIIKAIQTHRWRAETALPILRTVSYTVSPESSSKEKKPVFSSDASINANRNKSVEQDNINSQIIQYIKQHPVIAFYELGIKIEEVRCRLSEIEMLSFSQSIYLLKEMIIGFEVLVDLFGIFDPTERMVAVNNHGHWKMWINEDYSINIKQQSKKSQKEFIYLLIIMGEKHCIPSKQSKLFFSMLQEYRYSKDCSFIKMLEKINQFVSVNKVYQVNKVILPTKINGDPKANIQGPDRVTAIKNQLKKLIIPNIHNQEFKFSHFQNQTPGITNNSCYSMKQFSNLISAKGRNQLANFRNKQSQYIPSNIHKRFNTATDVNETSLQKQDHQKQQIIAHGWQQKSLEYGIISLNQSIKKEKQVNHKTEQAERPNMQKYGSSRQSKPINMSCLQNMPLYIPIVHKTSLSPNKINFSLQTISPTRHRQEIKHFYNQKNKKKPHEEPTKKVNSRKYSEQIVSMKNIGHTSSIEKNTGSGIYNGSPHTFLSKQVSPKQSEICDPVIVIHSASPKPGTSGSSSMDVKCYSKPNSTNPINQIPNQEELKFNKEQNYLKILNESRPKYNHSVINCPQISTENTPPSDSRKDKNMAVSYQFHDRAHHDLENIEKPEQKKDSTKQSKWKNKISGLFSDNISIRQLKESIQYKSREEEVFQKEYLKDIKLDLLQKFGRKVNHMTDDDDHYNSRKQGQEYKSMQLIEEEMQEVKSYLEEDQKNEDIPVKTNRCRNQTMQPNFNKQKKEPQQPKEILQQHYSSEYDDEDKDSEAESSNGGFNFQSESYSISPVNPVQQ